MKQNYEERAMVLGGIGQEMAALKTSITQSHFCMARDDQWGPLVRWLAEMD